MTDSSAYHIRLELLKLAQSIESECQMNERIRKENDWNAEWEMARLRNEPAPPFPTVETVDHIRIIQVARELNDFVSRGA